MQVQTVPVEKTPLALPNPAPLRITGPTWTVVTPKNVDSVWEELKKNNVDLVLFALTDSGYEQISVDYAQIRNLINEQREIILRYKDYYEPLLREKPAAVPSVEKPLSWWEKIFGRK